MLALSIIPLAAGAMRLTDLSGLTAMMPADPRFLASPAPLALHILSAGMYTILGAFQFAPELRMRRPGWHRAAGKLIALCGLIAGLTALWMTLFYPRAEGAGMLLQAFRILFGSLMIISIVLGTSAVVRGDLQRHRAWMIRGYAIGLGAGTQALTLAAGEWFAGPLGVHSSDWLMGAGWAINLAVAERVIRERANVRTR